MARSRTSTRVLAKFFAALKGEGLYDSSVIAIAADHGGAFGEHGEQSHGFFLYDETIHVPLLIKMPGTRASGIQVSSRVGLVDVAPTLLAAVGAQVPPNMQGISLLTLTRGTSPAPRIAKTGVRFAPRPIIRSAPSDGVGYALGVPASICTSTLPTVNSTRNRPIQRLCTMWPTLFPG